MSVKSFFISVLRSVIFNGRGWNYGLPRYQKFESWHSSSLIRLSLAETQNISNSDNQEINELILSCVNAIKYQILQLPIPISPPTSNQLLSGYCPAKGLQCVTDQNILILKAGFPDNLQHCPDAPWRRNQQTLQQRSDSYSQPLI